MGHLVRGESFVLHVARHKLTPSSPTHHVTGIAEVSRSPPSSPAQGTSALPKPAPAAAEASAIPGETEEDGLLRREYVLVGDRRAVEMNRAVDGKAFRLSAADTVQDGSSASPIEISNARRRPLRDRRMQPPPSPLVDDAMRNEYPGFEGPSPASANTTLPPPLHPNAPPLSSSPSSPGSCSTSNPLAVPPPPLLLSVCIDSWGTLLVCALLTR